MFVADFETTTNIEDCRVWAWALCSITPDFTVEYGNSIDTFFDKIKDLAKKNERLYFHNLKFDGEFIIYHLLTHDFKHVQTRSEITDNSFMTLIDKNGVVYSIEIIFKKLKTKLHHITIWDSFKVLPMSVDKVSQAYGIEDYKLSLDYETDREIGHELTEHEKEYIKNDVLIVAKALYIQFSQGLTHMTAASNALHEYKSIISKKDFDYWFPEIECDGEIRQSYKGGWCYLNPKYANLTIGNGLVLDVNSLYPSRMRDCILPYGQPKYYDGKYNQDSLYSLYVQIIRCNFELKEGCFPTIQLKHNVNFVETEYLTSSNGEDITLCLTSVDLELFLNNYNVYNLEYICGWKFKGSQILFTEYIDKWYKIKEESSITGNQALRTLAKLFLNSLYGKFGLNPVTQQKIPYLQDGMVKYRLGEKERRKPLYIPVATFITSYARYLTITSAQSVYDRFIYADTDSLHLLNNDIPNNLDISDTKLGAWKVESKFIKARFIRQKTYIEIGTDGTKKVTAAGMPAKLHEDVTFDNFIVGTEFNGKLRHTRVKGGIVLLPTTHKIK